jgi:hypothetical protein
MDWVSFRGTHPRGERRGSRLDQFVDMLTTRSIVRSKPLAPGFSATRYREHYVHESSGGDGKLISFRVTAPALWRSKNGVEAMTGLVLDVDDATPDWDRLASTGNLVIAFPTWSHRPDAPHWRLVVVPFASPVDVERWPSVFEAGTERFEPRADRSCADPAHLFLACGGTTRNGAPRGDAADRW